MRVTKTRNGYVIRCTPSDYMMLRSLISASGSAHMSLPPSERAALTRRSKDQGTDILGVDEDRSGDAFSHRIGGERKTPVPAPDGYPAPPRPVPPPE